MSNPADNWSIISWVLVSVFAVAVAVMVLTPLLRESIEGRKQLKTDKWPLFRRHY